MIRQTGGGGDAAGVKLRIAFACLGAAAWMLSSCAGPSASSPSSSGSSSLQPDLWGHRAGPQGFNTVIIDAGHGGKDSGAVSPWNGVKEKDLTLDTAKRVQALLSGSVKTQLMRGDDTFVELDDRVARASNRGNTILVSIHYNSGPSALRGPETYYWRVDSHGLATRVQRSISSVAPVQSGNRGLVRRRIRLTRNPNVPCILVEVGYLSNPSEVKLCSDPAYRDRMAHAIARAILDQKQNGDAGTGALPKPLFEPPSRPTDPAGS